jgi:hypothetical protein
MYDFSRVDGVRHTMQAVPGCVGFNSMLQTLCSQKQQKPGDAANRFNCTARLAQRSGIDV